MKMLSLAPCRISLFGGGTDLPTYSDKFGGMVISLAINIRQELALFTHPDPIPLNIYPKGADPDFYKKILKEFGIDAGVQSRFEGIIGAGLGSSASCTVALIGAINKALNLGLSRTEIAERAWEIETNIIGHYGGKQDQYAASFGGFNLLSFNENEVKVDPLKRDSAELIRQSLVLFYTGIKRGKNLQEGFKQPTEVQTEVLHRVKGIVYDALEQIYLEDIEYLGKLLDEAWRLKKRSNPVSNLEIDEIYAKGMSLGAWGGKLLGSGGGGYMVFMVDPVKKQEFIEKMGITSIDYSLDFNGLEVKEVI